MTPTTYSIFSGFVSGAMLIISLLLSLLHISQQSEWRSFRFARIYVSIACFVLAIVYGADAVTEHHSSHIEQIAWYGVSSFQALLFTITCIIFVSPRRRLMPVITVQMAITIVVLLLCIALYLYNEGRSDKLTPYLCVPVYIVQIAYFYHFFQHTYKSSLQHLEDVYDDELAGRLSWVRGLFYAALTVGLAATYGMVSFGYIYATIFEGSVVAIYAVIVVSFMNYHNRAFFVVKASKATPKDEKITVEAETADTLSAQDADEVQRHLDAWVEYRGFVKADLSVDEIVQELGVSRESFNAYFKYKLGTQFRSWRRELRLREAMRLLREDPTLPVPELMESVGYNDRSNFHKDFQRFTGQSLNEFRYQYR